MAEESHGSLTLWGEIEEAPTTPQRPKKPAPKPAPSPEVEQPAITPAPVSDSLIYPPVTYNKVMELLAWLLEEFTEEMISVAIHASTPQQAKEEARLADLWQQKLAKVREYAGKKG